MDGLIALAAVAVAVVSVLVTVETIRAPRRDPRTSRWFDLARGCRLTEIRCRGRLSEGLSGRLGSLEVEIGPYSRGKAQLATRVTIRRLSPLLAIKREGLGSRLGKTIGLDEIQVGDEAFDRALYVQGEERTVRTLLDAKTRKRLLTAFGSAAPVAFELHLADGALRAEFADDVHSGRIQSRGKVRWLLGLAQQLQEPTDIQRRLVKNAACDPEPAVRLKILEVLERTAPLDPTTRAAIERAAGFDAAPEVRLQAAVRLGRDGWPTLHELAADESIEDLLSARAIEALGEQMDIDHASRTLEAALGASRLATARAAVRALGWGGEPQVAAITEAMNRTPEIAAAAASALGQTRSQAAEAVLLALLRDARPEVQIAAVEALGHVGTAASVLPLKELAMDSGGRVRSLALQSTATIRARLTGADPGQLSFPSGADGQLAMADDPLGRVTMPGSDDTA